MMPTPTPSVLIAAICIVTLAGGFWLGRCFELDLQRRRKVSANLLQKAKQLDAAIKARVLQRAYSKRFQSGTGDTLVVATSVGRLKALLNHMPDSHVVLLESAEMTRQYGHCFLHEKHLPDGHVACILREVHSDEWNQREYENDIERRTNRAGL